MKKFSMKIMIMAAASLFFLVILSGEETPVQPVTAGNAANAAADGRMYGIGSVSKVFTAAAVMKLAEQGKLNLDTPLTAYIPDFTMADRRYAKITPRMLLNHSSGFMGSVTRNAMLLGDNDTYNHDQLLELLSRQTLKHEPGDRSIYSNDSFFLAEILVERVSGLGFTEFIEQNFLTPLGLKNIKTPQSDFDRALLANIYSGSNELLSENMNEIGTGGIYATMEDLARYAAIFMNSADGSVLSKKSVNEMAKNQHKMALVPPDSDTTLCYGLGWDSVDTYPFNQYGIKALSKGGDTVMYHTNLTILPEYNLAAAVSASGSASHAQLVAQEIILEVLREEGLIPRDSELSMPGQNLLRAKVPDHLLPYAGIYDAGMFGWWDAEFTEDSLIFTPIGVRNERPEQYIYNTKGEFTSTNGDYLGKMPGDETANGISNISFADGKYIITHTYKDFPGLSQTAIAIPFAEKIEANYVPASVTEAWKGRNVKEYLLVSEKYSSIRYFTALAKIMTDDRVPGYVTGGIYKTGENGENLSAAKIIDETTALGFQSTPTMSGRDINNIIITTQNRVEYLCVNETRYIDAAAIRKLNEAGGRVVIGTETVWLNIDADSGGQKISITMTYANQGAAGSWFLYDDKMNCVASSLEKKLRTVIVLPQNGRIAFAGEPGAEFILK